MTSETVPGRHELVVGFCGAAAAARALAKFSPSGPVLLEEALLVVPAGFCGRTNPLRLTASFKPDKSPFDSGLAPATRAVFPGVLVAVAREAGLDEVPE